LNTYTLGSRSEGMVSPLYTHTGTMYPFIVVVDC